jgi:hypothetical protein
MRTAVGLHIIHTFPASAASLKVSAATTTRIEADITMGNRISLFIGSVVTAVVSFGLTAIGFTPVVGIAAGSIAAGIQSTIGNVAAGSGFAALQSLGASGVLVAAGTLSTGAAVATVALSSGEEQ